MSAINYIENGSITTPKGFQATGIHVGIKEDEQLDLGVIYSTVPATAAVVETTNAVKAEPLAVTRKSVSVENKLQAILVNSGNANACTGETGRINALKMQKYLAKHLSLPNHYVAVSSTGVIGVQLPIEKIEKGIPKIKTKADLQEAKQFEKAILTTDTRRKKTAYKITIDQKEITIAGVAKGSGMIEPNMATMLGFITTDANICKNAWQNALKQVVHSSFNCITVDGDTSTNDTVIALANGLAENEQLNENHPKWSLFINALQKVATDLAKMIARDGEGATKLIEVEVTGAKTENEAIQVGKSVVGSSLVKTAVYGNDANWGRILAAVGYSGVPIHLEKINTSIGPIDVLKNGKPIAFDEEKAEKYFLNNDTIQIFVHLNNGNKSHKVWGCDLTYDYIKINATYRT